MGNENGKVISFERKALESGIEEIKNLSLTRQMEEEVFADIVYSALTRWHIAEDDFRDAFGLTEGAVHRWTQRQNLPQLKVRPLVIKWIREEMEGRLRQPS